MCVCVCEREREREREGERKKERGSVCMAVCARARVLVWVRDGQYSITMDQSSHFTADLSDPIDTTHHIYQVWW